ncbi:MAG: cell wall hydrolase [Syntrophales bacterium]|nr:cell wall hydrolase [Syntrophales bacterium]
MPPMVNTLPACLEQRPTVGIAETAAVVVHEEELLARVVYAEAVSTGYGDEASVYEGIAWGIMNRVRLVERFPALARQYGRGIRGVVFKKGQFNPTTSPRSPYAREFLCPRRDDRWRMAHEAAVKARRGVNNPFIATPWERHHGLSLVVNFYYPASRQARGPLAPWEGEGRLVFIGDVVVDGRPLPASWVRFYRLREPPRGEVNK